MTPAERVAALEKALEACDTDPPKPWCQMSDKYLSFDRGEAPQVFRLATDEHRALILLLLNEADYLISVAKAAVAWREHSHKYRGGVCVGCADDALAAAIDAEKGER